MLPIHNHSEYSALDGYAHPKEIADRIEKLGLPGAFLTDHGTVAGLTAFRDNMLFRNPKKKEGPRDLFIGYGMEAYQAKTSRLETKWRDGDMFLDKGGPKRIPGTGFKKGDDAFHLILLAGSPEGYRNLLRISDEANRTGFHYSARVDWELLKKYREGLICTSACMGSLACQEILEYGTTSTLTALYDIFRENFYVEVSTYDTDDQRALNDFLVSFAKERGYKLVYANDAHYAEPDQYDTHEALLCAQYQDYLLAPKKYSNVPEDPAFYHPQCLYIMGEQEVADRLSHLPEWAVDQAIDNSDAIMEQCRFELEKPGLYLPKFKVPADYDDSAHMLEALVIDGLEERYGLDDEEAIERAQFELESIVESGLQDYFLIVWDYINYALNHGILVGPGRGSVGGSILAYCLGITSIDPLQYNLQFERFWNPGRAEGLPDIDVDFERSSRQFMIEYAKKKYGPDRVLPISNHIFMRPKSAIDKAGMVLYEKGKSPYGALENIKKIIETTTDAGQPKPWDEMMELVGPDLRGEEDITGLNKKGTNYVAVFPGVFELASLLAGRLATYGVHASAVVIANVDLPDKLPSRLVSDDDGRKVLTTQAEMHEVEKAGFPKFDFLGLRNLDTAMMTAILSGKFGDADELAPKLAQLIEERNRGSLDRVDQDLLVALKEIVRYFRNDVDFDHLPDSFWKQIDNGYTLGFFQIDESRSPRHIGKQLRPRNIEDLAAIVALNRPGPLRDRDEEGKSTVDRFLARRNGAEAAHFPHEILAEILASTYGDFLYQEQVIAYFREIGYSLSDADHIRKILGKKLVEEMQAEYPTYLKAATQHMPEHTAKVIWESIENFSKYSFNKAHAVGYGIILAWTMYAKWKWPTEFIMASITTNPKKVPSYINEARRIQVPIRPPDINEAEVTISKKGDGIVYGLVNIKGIGEDAAKWVVQNRPYSSPEDFYERAAAEKPIVVKANHRQAFMDAGCFDGFGYRLAKCEACEGKGRRRINPRSRLLDDCPECGKTGYQRVDLPSFKEVTKFEQELLGIVLTLDTTVIGKYATRIKGCDSWAKADTESKSEIKIPGVVTAIDNRRTAPDANYNADRDWARVTIQWEGEELTFAAFPDAWDEFGFMLRPQNVGEFTLVTGPKGSKLKRGYHYH